MPYIGKQLVRGQNRKLDDISSGFNGSQTTFTLQVASQNVTVGSALQLWISLGGVIQDPLSDYTIAGNQITFTTAPASGLDFFGVIQGDVTDTNTPGDATVTTSKLSTGLTVNLADGSAATSSLQLGGTDSGLFSSAADKVNVTTGGVERLEIGDSEVVFNDPSNDVDFRVESNGKTHMLFVDAGNNRIGIGTSSPTKEVDIVQTGGDCDLRVQSTDTGGDARLELIADNTGVSQIRLGDQDSANPGAITYDHSVNALHFKVNASERARIDSSGRLLVGVSSSRNVGFAHTVQIEGTDGITSSMSLIRNSNDNNGPHIDFAKSRGTSTGSNTVVQSGDTLGNLVFRGVDGSDANTVACQIQGQVDGTPGSNDMPGRLVFKTTSDGASSATERMRIDSSGRVGLGTTSPGCQTGGIHAVHANNEGTPSFTGGEVAIFQRNFNNAQGCHVGIIGGTTGTSSINFGDKDDADVGIIQYGHSDNSMRFFANTSERMRIDSNGRVLVGTTSAFGATASELLQVANSNGGKISLLRNDTSIGTGNEIGVITWYSADGTTQAAASIACHADGDHATDDKPGRLVFSTTEDGASSPDEKMRIFNTGQTHHFSTVNGLFVGSSLGAGATNWLFRGNRNRTNNSQGGVTVFYVFTNGNVQNTNNSYGAISDVKLKENIVDATSQWDDLKALRVRKYNLIEGETHTQLGVVAQEVETVSPGLVNDITDRDEEGNDLGTVTKTVNYSVLYMKAVKALQEAMDRIETLETKVAALEAE